LQDCIEKKPLTRAIWNLLRPFDPPVYTAKELADALTDIVEGACSQSDAIHKFGIPVITIKRKLRVLRSSFSPIVLLNEKAIKDLFLQEPSWVISKIHEICYSIKRGPAPLLSQLNIDIVMSKSDYARKCGMGLTNKQLGMAFSSVINASGIAEVNKELTRAIPCEKRIQLGKRKSEIVLSEKTTYQYKKSVGNSKSFSASVINIKRLVRISSDLLRNVKITELYLFTFYRRLKTPR